MAYGCSDDGFFSPFCEEANVTETSTTNACQSSMDAPIMVLFSSLMTIGKSIWFAGQIFYD